MLDLANKNLQGTTEKIAAGCDAHRPSQRSGGIEQNELFKIAADP